MRSRAGSLGLVFWPGVVATLHWQHCPPLLVRQRWAQAPGSEELAPRGLEPSLSRDTLPFLGIWLPKDVGLPILGLFPSLLPQPCLPPITFLPGTPALLKQPSGLSPKLCPGACHSTGFRLEGQARGLSWGLNCPSFREFPETQASVPVSALTPRGQ